MLLVCSVPHGRADLEAHMPLTQLSGGSVGCVGRCCGSEAEGRLGGERVVIGEWDTVARWPQLAETCAHVVAVDPPYRAQHSALLQSLGAQGVNVHLAYGDTERSRTADLLKYLVHPRFAMVCVYRALMRGARGGEIHKAAAELAWREGHVVLSAEDLERAREVLAQLGLERPVEGAARIEASVVPQYADAEAEYEECSRLCRIL
jgi:hypothetical protein